MVFATHVNRLSLGVPDPTVTMKHDELRVHRGSCTVTGEQAKNAASFYSRHDRQLSKR
jgi:hypothetical protein